MFDNFIMVAGQVAALFLMMAVGYTLVKLKKLSEETTSQMSYLLLYIVMPCLVVKSLQIERDFAKLAEIGLTSAACFIYFTIAISISFCLFRRKNPDIRAIMRVGTIYPNVGFMGVPLVKAVLGDDIMLYAITFIVVFSLLQWTHGIIIMGGKKQVSVKNALINPGTVGLVLGLALFLLNLRLPWPLNNALGFISDVNTPIAMIVIGAQMARSDILKTLRYGVLYYAGALKLIVFPAVTAFALLPLALPPMIYTTVVILSAAPSASMTAMFAQRFNRDYPTAAQYVSLTTLLSIITLPLFAVLANTLAGSI